MIRFYIIYRKFKTALSNLKQEKEEFTYPPLIIVTIIIIIINITHKVQRAPVRKTFQTGAFGRRHHVKTQVPTLLPRRPIQEAAFQT